MPPLVMIGPSCLSATADSPLAVMYVRCPCFSDIALLGRVFGRFENEQPTLSEINGEWLIQPEDPLWLKMINGLSPQNIT
jgi:hypothetical protein